MAYSHLWDLVQLEVDPHDTRYNADLENPTLETTVTWIR